jgi:hypothetical protein
MQARNCISDKGAAAKTSRGAPTPALVETAKQG